MIYVVEYDECLIYKFSGQTKGGFEEQFTSFEEAKESLIDYYITLIENSKIKLKQARNYGSL